MFDNARAAAEIGSRLMNEVVPPIDLISIQGRMNARSRPAPHRALRLRLAAAVVAMVLVSAGVFVSPGSAELLQSVRQTYEAALHAAGIGPPKNAPRVPEAMLNAMKPTRVSLAQARKRANFALDAPIGLPHDIVSYKIFASPLAVWTRQTNTWTFDGVQITFDYTRANGSVFSMIAYPYSPLGFPVGRYVFNVDAPPRVTGNLTRAGIERFVWRNGDQAIQVKATTALSAAEIERIRTAMHGDPLPRYDDPAKNPDVNRAEMFVIPER